MNKYLVSSLIMVFCGQLTLHGQPTVGSIAGVVRNGSQSAISGATVSVRNVADNTLVTMQSGPDGSYQFTDLQPGQYEVEARSQDSTEPKAAPVQLAAGQAMRADVTVPAAAAADPAPAVASATPTGGFLKRFAQAYSDDWKGTASSGPDPKYRGYAAPVSNPPWPFTVWPYGGSVTIGQPWTQAGPLMTAIWGGSHGDAWKRSGVQVYGWLNGGVNASTSKGKGYSTYPEAYPERGNTVQLDQEVLYIERQPDTVQTDHVDWGFRIASLYGLDYRFTTAKGIFSNQLLGKNQENGFDVPMIYADIYVPQIAQGMDIRIGRYISLPDIEAQLAPNNYTYSHSLTYTFDCYTQSGINTTTKLTDHWLFQLGFSAGCDVAPWKAGAKGTFNTCLGYTWRAGLDNVYTCANSINNGNYAYNNLAAYYATWYHKYHKGGSWHTATEAWYQYEKHTPNVNNAVGSTLVQTNANGAVCNNDYEVRCYAPSWAIVNYQENQLSKHDYLSIRNEYFDDIKGQRTGFKSRYSEHMIGWGHWVGTTALFRPELRYERAYDYPAYNNGTRKNQFTFAADAIFFF